MRFLSPRNPVAVNAAALHTARKKGSRGKGQLVLARGATQGCIARKRPHLRPASANKLRKRRSKRCSKVEIHRHLGHEGSAGLWSERSRRGTRLSHAVGCG